MKIKLEKVPKGKRFAESKPASKLGWSHWWETSLGYIRVYTDEYGKTVKEAQKEYMNHPIAGRFVDRS